MLRRPGSARFAPGAYIFPGGILDQADWTAARSLFTRDARTGLVQHFDRMSRGGHFEPNTVEASAALLVCAARELFEESGILIARSREGRALLATSADLGPERELLLAGRQAFGDLCAGRGLALDPRDFIYFSHWITPSAMKLRYDTHFFLATVPPGQTASHFPGEMDCGIWISPADALRRHAVGTFPMVPVQTRHLERMAGFQTVAALIEYARGKEVRAVLAEVVDGAIFIPEEARTCW